MVISRRKGNKDRIKYGKGTRAWDQKLQPDVSFYILQNTWKIVEIVDNFMFSKWLGPFICDIS